MVWILGVAAAATFFASGALVARATMDNETNDPGDRAQVVLPGIAVGDGNVSPRSIPYGANDVVGIGKDSGWGGRDAIYPACRTPLPPGVVTAKGIDPSAAGFAAVYSGTGFSALSLSINSTADCDKDGDPAGGGLSIDSSWLHDATNIEAYVSQRASDKPVANVIRDGSATFWANGYIFDVSVNSYRYDGPVPAFRDGSTSSGSAPAVDPARPIAQEVDPQAASVLQQLIEQLAPSTDLKCFWTVGPGDWSDLAALGIGDPRPAIPAGFDQQDFNVTAFEEPAAGCDTSVKPQEGFSFNAGWRMSGSDFSYINVSVWGGGSSGQDYPGQISEYGANWSRDGLQFGVYAKAENPLGIDLIRSLAKVLDPKFDEACFIQERQLTNSDLPGLGFSPAKAPDGFTLSSSSLTGSEIAAGCDRPDGFESSYNLNWNFESGADTINAGANRYGSSQTGDGSGYQSQNNLNWTSANGTNYYVNGYSRGISPVVSQDALVAIAKSMDPAFDLAKLEEGPEHPIGPLPMPAAEEKPR